MIELEDHARTAVRARFALLPALALAHHGGHFGARLPAPGGLLPAGPGGSPAANRPAGGLHRARPGGRAGAGLRWRRDGGALRRPPAGRSVRIRPTPRRSAPSTTWPISSS